MILNTAAFADGDIPWRIRLCRLPGIGEFLVRGFNGFAWPATWMAVTKPLPADASRAASRFRLQQSAGQTAIRDPPFREGHPETGNGKRRVMPRWPPSSRSCRCCNPSPSRFYGAGRIFASISIIMSAGGKSCPKPRPVT